MEEGTYVGHGKLPRGSDVKAESCEPGGVKRKIARAGSPGERRNCVTRESI